MIITQQYNIKGMSCAVCSAAVEKAVSKVPGVTDCSVSLLTNSMAVDGTAESKAIIKAVKNAGYGASKSTANQSVGSEKAEIHALVKRLITSAAFLIILMYFSMGHSMLGLPLPSVFEGNNTAIGIIQMLAAAIIAVINRQYFISGFKAVMHRSPNMDTLVSLGSGVSFCWSIYVLITIAAAQARGLTAANSLNDLYFESAAMILTLITVGKTLEAKAKGKTTDALGKLIKSAPQTAAVIKDGKEITVNIQQVQKGDIFVVRPGESVPVDGIILEGITAIDQSALTGESIPVDKKDGDTVSGGTVNQSGFIRCRALRVGEDTAISQIIKAVREASATKAPIAKIADRVSSVFVPAVILISIITLICWLLIGRSPGYALARAISVLVISCPCSLGLATPVAIMVGNGIGAKSGILFKTAAAL